MRTLTHVTIILAFILMSLTGIGANAADYTVTVNCSQDKASTAFMQGFLHGFSSTDTLDSTLIGTNLDPNFWRIGLDTWTQYPKIEPFAPVVTVVLSDVYAAQKGGYSNAKPWLNWTEWEDYCIDQVEYSINNDMPVAYWDIWSEPDTAAMWTGTYAQLLETFQRAYNAVKSVDANAKVVGPSKENINTTFSCDNTKGLGDFLLNLSQSPYNVRLDAVSWHELGSLPSYIATSVPAVRDFLANPTYFNPAYAAEIHISEYSQPNNTQIPGWILGWLYYAEQEDIDWFTRACWNMWEGAWPFTQTWSNCTAGCNGLFMRDMTTIQQPYYVYWNYALLNAYPRIVVSSTNSDVIGLANKNSSASKVTALVGVFNKTVNSSVDVTFTNFPYSSTVAAVTVNKLINNNVLDGGQNPKAQAAVAPTQTYSGNITISGGSFTVNISAFAEGEMYIIEAVPGSGTPPSKATNPNPASGATNVSTTADLSWTAGSGATSHDVYFGTSNPPTFKQNQTATTYDPGTMSGNTLYYWRIDEKNSAGTTTGDVWSFTTWPVVYQPNAVSTIQGTYVSGNLASCISDDNNYYVTGSHLAPTQQFNFTIAQARAEVTSLRGKVRSKDSKLTGNTRYLAFWNYDTNGWESVAANSVSTSESNLEFTVTTNPGRFVGTDKVVIMAVQHNRSSLTHSQYCELVQVGVNGG